HTGEPVHPAIVWQCRRSTDEASALSQPDNICLIRQRTGLDLDPTFTATKLKWISNHRPEIARGLACGDVLFGTVDTWILWKLTGGKTYASESSNASRTMLFRIDELEWDQDLVRLFELHIDKFPDTLASTGPFGLTEQHWFDTQIPICGVLGDQQAALFGHGCFDKGQVKATYGTGAFVWSNAGDKYNPIDTTGFLQTVAWHLDHPTYALEGFVMYAGATIDWLVNTLGVNDAIGVLRAASEVGDSEGVFLLPAFQGLASPWWRPTVRAAMLGLSGASRREHICQAGLEAICFQVRSVCEPMAEALGAPIEHLRVDGGLTRSEYLMQTQADILCIPLFRSTVDEVTAYGVALLAGLGGGFWRDLDELLPLIGTSSTYKPRTAARARWDEHYARWLKGVDAVTDWSA
ncbi:MAG: FGGY-family carbohydrate kinase, partial [Gammaproteobacteria bacterium]|nr:FGGY-family carbohydrate kinase [Gammaproteobacteria bacterium]